MSFPVNNCDVHIVAESHSRVADFRGVLSRVQLPHVRKKRAGTLLIVYSLLDTLQNCTEIMYDVYDSEAPQSVTNS